uniref:Uncharacterized protein n=1 Tax=Romanomermis culicivorax TaxID=13658 RepID=A0A915IBQ5_ROMCU
MMHWTLSCEWTPTYHRSREHKEESLINRFLKKAQTISFCTISHVSFHLLKQRKADKYYAILSGTHTQQLRVQGEIQEQVKSTNTRFTALAEQMQQLISTTATTAAACNPPTPRPPPVTSRFLCEET